MNGFENSQILVFKPDKRFLNGRGHFNNGNRFDHPVHHVFTINHASKSPALWTRVVEKPVGVLPSFFSRNCSLTETHLAIS
jgi:hypothetical protein